MKLSKSFIAVRVHLPLKQGLRLSTLAHSMMPKTKVRVHLPLKQGLRLDDKCFTIVLVAYECIFH